MRKRTSMVVLMALILAMLVVAPNGISQNPAGQAKRLAGVLVFDLHPNRISPASATLSEGWYLIRVRNGVSTAALQVNIDRPGQPRILDTAIPAGRSGVQKLVHLQPGTHTLRVGTRAVWVSAVTVKPGN